MICTVASLACSLVLTCRRAEPVFKILQCSTFHIRTPTRSTHISAAHTYGNTCSVQRGNEKSLEIVSNIASFKRRRAETVETIFCISNANLHFKSFLRAGEDSWHNADSSASFQGTITWAEKTLELSWFASKMSAIISPCRFSPSRISTKYDLILRLSWNDWLAEGEWVQRSQDELFTGVADDLSYLAPQTSTATSFLCHRVWTFIDSLPPGQVEVRPVGHVTVNTSLPCLQQASD